MKRLKRELQVDCPYRKAITSIVTENILFPITSEVRDISLSAITNVMPWDFSCKERSFKMRHECNDIKRLDLHELWMLSSGVSNSCFHFELPLVVRRSVNA